VLPILEGLTCSISIGSVLVPKAMTLCSSKSRLCRAFAQYEIGFFKTPRPFGRLEFTHRRPGKNRWIWTTTSKRVTGGNVPENRKTMAREEFLLEMDEILGRMLDPSGATRNWTN
jgi:hypothetical protein